MASWGISVSELSLLLCLVNIQSHIFAQGRPCHFIYISKRDYLWIFKSRYLHLNYALVIKTFYVSEKGKSQI